ncbi:hypothetical protein ACGFJT_42315 [Actinomadura geliboluensis]|uniref:hypothetical protein n=1 Tax=Actinomadura geliboluensis TaxID=882440 RepID=UPI00371821F8
MTDERVLDTEPAAGTDPADATPPGGGERPAPGVWLINLGMGPQFHALPSADDPGTAPPRGFEAATWPTVDAAAACGHAGRFRRGGYRHTDLPRCPGCCAATGTEEGYGPRSGAPTGTSASITSGTTGGSIR